MAKEMMIVFIYDTSRSNDENNDPGDSVVYFHPAWVSPTQKLALAGQIMGVNQFLTTMFSPPSIICLQGGKFVIKKFGKFILAAGTDRNIQDWILERRANILYSLIKFYHCDIETILLSVNSEKNKFTEKLYQIFETYLPILQYNANLFSNLPLLKLPRSASNIFLEAVQILQYCQENNGIIGGSLFYNNKIIASQFNTEITKHLVITDPYRIKIPADKITTNFNLQQGVQLLNVYIPQKYFKNLVQEANLERGYSSNSDPVIKKAVQKKSLSKSSSKDQSLSILKRDTSRIFTVPEDAELDSTCYNVKRSNSPIYTTAYSSPAKKINENASEKPKHHHPLTPSVCSTPLKDVNRVLHDFAVSICSTTEENNENQQSDNKNKKEQNTDDIPDVVREALRCKRLNKLKNPTTKEKLIIDSQERLFKSLSSTDLRDSVNKFTLGIPKLNENLDNKTELDSPKINSVKKKFYTITDPCFPVFKSNGLPISNFLYNQSISSHYEELNKSSKLPVTKNEFKPNLKNLEKLSLKNCKTIQEANKKQKMNINANVDNKVKQESYRRSMSLPIKPLNILDNNDDRRKSTAEVGGLFELPQRRKLDGLQLTPLMSKLSILADERTSGYCSKEITPSEFRDISSFFISNKQLGKNKLDNALKNNQKENSKELGSEDYSLLNSDDEIMYEKCELFLCGHQNMILFLIMENGTANNFELINSFWEICVNHLGSLEEHLQKCLEPLPSHDNKELYSALSIDSEWDTIHRSGLWGVTELDVVSSIHNQFLQNNNITDITIRTDDSVVYGNKCGKTEVFYQQSVPTNISGGLPAPADLMGIAPLKAKRRLERDHAILIL